MDIKRFEISKDLEREIQQQLKDDIFEDAVSRKNPRITILGGQPGSGKSKLIETVQNRFDSAPIIINGDELRKYHPHHKEIFRTSPEQYADITDVYVRQWTKNTFDAAIANKFDIVFEGTMRTPQICETIKELKSQNYSVDIAVMSVNQYYSRLSIYQRYYEQLQTYGIARITSVQSHNEAYTGMLKTLGIIEKEKLYDTLTVHSKTCKIFDISDCKNITATETLVLNRERKWNKQELEIFNRELGKVRLTALNMNNQTHIKEMTALKNSAKAMMDMEKSQQKEK